MSFTITTITPQPTPFELASGQWAKFLANKPFADFRRSQMRPGSHDSSLNLTRMATILALCNLLAQLQGTLREQGLAVSELILVLWVLECLEPGLRSFLERSLAKELVLKNVGFNTLKLHLEVWSRVLTVREHTRRWNRETRGSVDLVEFWAGQGAQKHAELVRRWQAEIGWLSGENDVKMAEAPPLW